MTVTLPPGLTASAAVAASSANLGPGFDSLGVALGRYDEIVVETAPDGIHVEVEGEGFGQISTGADNLVAQAVVAGLRAAGAQAAGLILRSTDSVSGYRIHFDTKNDQIIVARYRFGHGRVELDRRRKVRMDSDTWYTAETQIRGAQLTVRLNGEDLLSVADPEPIRHGVAGVYTSQGRVDFDSRSG